MQVGILFSRAGSILHSVSVSLEIIEHIQLSNRLGSCVPTFSNSESRRERALQRFRTPYCPTPHYALFVIADHVKTYHIIVSCITLNPQTVDPEPSHQISIYRGEASLVGRREKKIQRFFVSHLRFRVSGFRSVA